MEGEVVEHSSDRKPERVVIHDRAVADLTTKVPCSGCSELSKRVEKLESQLAMLLSNSMVHEPTLGTTSCYWVIIFLHCFVGLFMMTGIGYLIAYPFLLGALGTWVVCHALPLRSVLMKWLRSILSLFVVLSACAIPMMAMEVDVADLLPLLLFLPMVALPALLGAQAWVWIAGWRIMPPSQQAKEIPRFRIVDIFAVTALAAVYAALFQFADFEDYDIDLADGGWIYVGLLVALSTLIGFGAAMIARAFLAPGKVSKLWLMFAFLAIGVPAVGLTFFMLGMAEGLDDLGTVLLTFLLYGVGGVAILLASPVFTFFMMRIARYRITSSRMRPSTIERSVSLAADEQSPATA